MKIGIISAMQVESESIRRQMVIRREETVTGMTFVSGDWLGHEAVVVVGGIGKVAAAMCAQTMILRYAPNLIFNTGVAGGMEALSVLDVVIAAQTVQHDMDTTSAGDPLGMIPGLDKIFIPCNYPVIAEKVDALVARRPDVRLGTVASGDQFVGSQEKMRDIERQFDALAVDMESGAIGQVCYIAQVPCCIIRTISDSGDGQEYDSFLDAAAEKSIEVLCALLA